MAAPANGSESSPSAIGAALFESSKLEQTQIEAGRLLIEQRGGNFADGGRELKSMPRTWAGNDHLAMQWMPIQDKVFVWRIRVDADHG